MLNRHELVDVATVRATALLVRNGKIFGRSMDAPPLLEAVAGTTPPVDALGDPATAGRTHVAVETPMGSLETAYLPWQWHGPEAPTVVYHHGSGERPFEFGGVGGNTFQRLFVDVDLDRPVNVIGVRAPFHDRPSRAYLDAMGELGNFVGMLAASTVLLEALRDRLADRTDAPVGLAGLSLGGFATNLHRACYGGADRYVPLLAGAALDELFVASVYRHLVAGTARRKPDRLRELLDFEAAFSDVPAEDCHPLLARYDRLVEYDRQRGCYDGMDLAVIEKGHVTGALAADALRAHVLDAVSTPGASEDPDGDGTTAGPTDGAAADVSAGAASGGE